MDGNGQDFESIWAETTDGGLLRQLFGSYPTLHNAIILGLEVNASVNTVTLMVHYSDDGGESNGLCVGMNLSWGGVERFDLPLVDNQMMSLKFSRKGNFIVSSIETSPGQFGEIVSETFEAVLKQVDPMEDVDSSMVRYRLIR